MLPPKDEMLRVSQQRLLSDKLLQHHDVQRTGDDVLCAGTDVLRADGDVLWRCVRLLRSGVERQCRAGPGSGDSSGSGTCRLSNGCCLHDDRPGSRGGRCPREPGNRLLETRRPQR
jgi:hypothetical protein